MRPRCHHTRTYHPIMARRGSAGTRRLRGALRTVETALERGEVPRSAPDLTPGCYGRFWIDPSNRVFIPVGDTTPERAHQALTHGAQLIIDPCGCGAMDATCGLEWVDQPERDRLSRQQPTPRYRGTLHAWATADQVLLICAHDRDWLR